MSAMTDKYILDEAGNPVPEPDLLRWARWFESSSPYRVVQQDLLECGVRVSTIFLGLDHSFGGHGLPVLWETMIFRGKHDGYQERYTSREDAVAGHAVALKLAQEE